MLASRRPVVTFDEYCSIEADGPTKHEYLDGQAWAMAGGSRQHAAICANVLGLLATHLRGKPCQAHTSDLRVRVLATGLATYPDASVICGKAELDPQDRLGHTVTNPTVLVEVLSPSTEEYDRGDKLGHYQRIEALREIVLFAHDGRRADVFRRSDDGQWIHQLVTEGDVCLESVPCVLPLADVYADPLA
jgi:Uma2 family endonuclease